MTIKMLRIPLLSRLIKGINAARFARTFSILMASGVPVLECLHIASQVIGNLPMREAVEQAAIRVKEGSGLHRALGESGYFPPMLVQMIASGEASGDLDQMLTRAADYQERDLNNTVTTMVGLLGPLMLLFMAGIVVLVVLSVVLPMLDMNAVFNREGESNEQDARRTAPTGLHAARDHGGGHHSRLAGRVYCAQRNWPG